jgi:hypothetical protein
MKYKIVIFLLFGVFMVETKVVRDQNKFTVGIAWTVISCMVIFLVNAGLDCSIQYVPL